MRLMRVGTLGDQRPVVRDAEDRTYVVCVGGLNYTDHAAEIGTAVPSAPVGFLKASNTVVGPDDDVLLPGCGTRTRLGG
jgi:2-keto-4-pentenoate hydratase/2-oxohepta-3-ene-1,7-dioic acid hydratase in catechol pathway